MVYAARLCSQWQAHDGGPVFISPMSGCSAGAGEKGAGLMSYYRICPICGAALDPGERCSNCQTEPSTKLEKTEKAAPVLEHRSGRVETGLQSQISTSSLTK